MGTPVPDSAIFYLLHDGLGEPELRTRFMSPDRGAYQYYIPGAPKTKLNLPIIAVFVEEIMSNQSPNPGFVPESWSLYGVGALFVILRL